MPITQLIEQNMEDAFYQVVSMPGFEYPSTHYYPEMPVSFFPFPSLSFYYYLLPLALGTFGSSCIPQQNGNFQKIVGNSRYPFRF